jgi:hypothetical protein
MSNKTCGECTHYLAEMFHCQKNDVMAESFNTCEDFEPKVITNGDRIQQGGNRAIAKFAYKTAQTRICGMCAFATIENGRYVCKSKDGQSCVDGIEAWLNAPADAPDTNVATKGSEGKDD